MTTRRATVSVTYRRRGHEFRVVANDRGELLRYLIARRPFGPIATFVFLTKLYLGFCDYVDDPDTAENQGHQETNDPDYRFPIDRFRGNGSFYTDRKTTPPRR